MHRALSAILEPFRRPTAREILAWSAPALLIGLALRVLLCIHMPYGYFHDDAPDFLTTPDRFIEAQEWELHEKKTFLVPLLFSLPFALPFPALVTIPIAQHMVGLGLIVMIGALCRYWFTAWKVWIVPITVLAAVNPFYLWYEHTLMAETIFVASFVLLALTGTLYARKQSVRRLVALCISLVLVAGARPEGKLLFGFALLMVALLHWRDTRTAAIRVGIVLALGILTHLATKTSQAGLLLYTAVARLTPTELSSAPGLDPYIAPIRADLQRRWEQRPQFPRVRDRKALAAAVEQYLKDDPSRGISKRRTDVNKFCMKLARETCLKNIPALPGLAITKFTLVSNESPADRFTNEMLYDKQREAFIDGSPRNLRLSHGLTGTTLNSEHALQGWIDTHYGEVPWFNRLTNRWLKYVNAARLPDRQYANPDPPFYPHTHFGLPYYFMAAAAGLLFAMLRGGELRAFHVSWALTLVGFFFVIMLTANVRPRFRFVFEPFWFIYVAMIVDTLVLGARRLLAR